MALRPPPTRGGAAGSPVEVMASVDGGLPDTRVDPEAADHLTTGWHFHGHGCTGNSCRQYFGGLPRRLRRVEVADELISVRTDPSQPVG
jgi:hypothetical protein